MTHFTSIIRSGLLTVTLIALPGLAQTDPNRPADTSSNMTRTDNGSDDGFDMGWLGLVGLAGLAGLTKKSPATVHRTDEGNARVYSKT